MNAASINFFIIYTKYQIKLKYRYTYLGFLWNFLEPLLYLMVLTIVFSVVNRMNIQDYAVFLFAALVPWRYFEKVVLTAMESIVCGDWLLKKMYVSYLTFPLIRWSIASIEFLFSFTVVLFLFLFLKNNWTIHLLILPLSVLPWTLFSLGAGLICAVLYTFFRDIKNIVQMLLMFVFFSSPILFKTDLFKDHSLQTTLLSLHPITYFAALFQKPIYYALWPSPVDWIVSIMVSLLFFVAGCFLLNKYKNRFYFYL